MLPEFMKKFKSSISYCSNEGDGGDVSLNLKTASYIVAPYKTSIPAKVTVKE
jgi:hypothetical protein